jgi:ribosomal protein S18 acetylase RimI-like enzyme
MNFDNQLQKSDVQKIKALLCTTGVFTPIEIDIAIELAEDTLSGKDASYQFILARNNETLLAYTCFGEIPLTNKRYDLYWIAVNKTNQNNGIGRQVLEKTEAKIKALGGEIVYIETSGSFEYINTQNFYLKQGYQLIATLTDFYADNNDKLIYEKRL